MHQFSDFRKMLDMKKKFLKKVRILSATISNDSLRIYFLREMVSVSNET